MVPPFKKYLIDQDALEERRRKQVQQERALRTKAETEAAAGIRKTLNTKPDTISWCPDL